MRTPLLCCAFTLALAACGGDRLAQTPATAGTDTGPALKSFGFVAVDCNFDDPHDLQGPRDYVDEVAAFTNTAHSCVFDSTDDMRARLDRLAANDMRALLHVEAVLFTQVPDPTAPGGLRDALALDYAERWQQFVSINASVLDDRHVATIYLVDEPFLHHLPYEDLQTASDLVASTHPDIARSFVEAWSALDAMRVPLSVDWVGFDDYAIPDPSTDPRYLESWEKLKAARSRADQGLLIIMDAQWTPDYPAWGMMPADMATVAANYLKLAQSEPDVVALIGYIWPGGLDNPAQKGARELPENVQQEYRRIGALITGKAQQP